jgi:hypothetical protein
LSVLIAAGVSVLVAVATLVFVPKVIVVIVIAVASTPVAAFALVVVLALASSAALPSPAVFDALPSVVGAASLASAGLDFSLRSARLIRVADMVLPSVGAAALSSISVKGDADGLALASDWLRIGRDGGILWLSDATRGTKAPHWAKTLLPLRLQSTGHPALKNNLSESMS